MKQGYLYVLSHPSDPNLYKIGITTRTPELRLAEHNSNFEEYTGQIVKNTGQKWELKEFHTVPDPYWAESVFWAATPLADIPYRFGVEVERMTWDQIQKGVDVAKKSGVRPGPGPLPDYVYAYTASIKKRLEGRGITLLGYVRSPESGKANFRCTNGHDWRTTPMRVGEGQGCPECGIGERESAEIIKSIKAGVICLLTNPDMPGFVKIGLFYGTLENARKDWPWGDWEMHRYRNVEEVALAESIILNFLGEPLAQSCEPFRANLNEAEEAFRNLIYAIREVIALREKAIEATQK